MGGNLREGLNHWVGQDVFDFICRRGWGCEVVYPFRCDSWEFHWETEGLL